MRRPALPGRAEQPRGGDLGGPVQSGQVTQEEIERCEKDPKARLALVVKDLPAPSKRGKGPRYTPVTKRGDKPDAIAWLLRSAPNLSDTQIHDIVQWLLTLK